MQTSSGINLQYEKNKSDSPNLLEENIFFNPKCPQFKSNFEIISRSSCLKEITHSKSIRCTGSSINPKTGNEFKKTFFHQHFQSKYILEDQEREVEMNAAQGGVQLSETRKQTISTNSTPTVSDHMTCSKYLNDAPNCKLREEMLKHETFSHSLRGGKNNESLLDKILTCSNNLKSLEKQDQSYICNTSLDLNKDGCLVINSFGPSIYHGNQGCLKNNNTSNCFVVHKIKHKKLLLLNFQDSLMINQK